MKFGVFLRKFLSISLAVVTLLEAALYPIVVEADEEPSCVWRVLDEKFGEKNLRIIDASSVNKKGDFVKLNELFGENPEVLLGITPSGHSYLTVENVRYDGEAFTHFGAVRSHVSMVNDGIILRFKDLPPATIESLKKNLLAKAGKRLWSSSCFSGACNELQRVGIRLEDGKPLLPATFFQRIFHNGFVDSAGSPIPLEIYRTDPTSINEIHSTLVMTQVAKMLPPGIILLFAGTSVFFLLRGKHHKR